MNAPIPERILLPEKRVGLIVPSVNRVVEVEWRWALPPSVQAYVSRAQYQFSNPDPLEGLLQDAPKAAEDLRQCGVDVGAFACTGASFYHGADGNQQLGTRLSTLIGAPCSTASQAVTEALQRVRAQDVALITPYAQEDVDREVAFLEHHGFRIAQAYGMGIADAQYESAVPYRNTYRAVTEHVSDHVDTILISCTNLFSWALVPLLEKALGKAVITSNQALLYAVLDRLEMPMIDPAWYGALFATAPVRPEEGGGR